MKVLSIRSLVSLAIASVLCLLPAWDIRAEALVIDAVVATVDGEPITLSEVAELMPPPRPGTLEAARNDAVFKSTLESLIAEKLLELEAASKRINVSDSEINSYIDKIAERNGLSRDDFASALKKEGKTLEGFQRSVRSEILRTKLASTIVQEGVAVSDQDVNAHLEQIVEADTSEQKNIKLRQILISTEKRFTSEAEQKCKDLHEQLKQGADFSELAQQHSDGPEAKDGGALEVLAEKDLNPVIFDAVLTLDDGEFSDPVLSDSGCQIFMVDGRYNLESKSDKSELRAEVRKQLERQRLEEKFQTYFTSEVYKNHTVERKV